MDDGRQDAMIAEARERMTRFAGRLAARFGTIEAATMLTGAAIGLLMERQGPQAAAHFMALLAAETADTFGESNIN